MAKNKPEEEDVLATLRKEWEEKHADLYDHKFALWREAAEAGL